MSYNGWKNYETWNVALWVGNDGPMYWANDKPLYRAAVEYAEREEHPTYCGFVWACLGDLGAPWTTPDDVLWLDPTLDYPRLDEMIRELGGKGD